VISFFYIYQITPLKEETTRKEHYETNSDKQFISDMNDTYTVSNLVLFCFVFVGKKGVRLTFYFLFLIFFVFFWFLFEINYAGLLSKRLF